MNLSDMAHQVFWYFCSLIVEQQENNNPRTTSFGDCVPRQEFDDMIKRVVALETKLENETVVFSAAMGHGNYHFGKYNTDKILKFKRVITNIGKAYKQSSGRFVAPCAGIYYFVFFHHAGGKLGTDLYLIKEEERIVQAQHHPLILERAQNGGNAAFLKLNAGDNVYLSLSPETHVWASDTHTTFSGFLVKRTEDEKADS